MAETHHKPYQLFNLDILFFISGCDSMKLISYSDVASCVKGCNEMRKLQKKEVNNFFFYAVTVYFLKELFRSTFIYHPFQIEDSIIDYKENISGNIGQESTDHVEETDVARIDGTGIRTFVVVRHINIRMI